MPGPTSDPSEAAAAVGNVLQDLLSTAAGTIGVSAGQLFATPSPYRNRVLITHNGGGNSIYVGFSSDVSTTKWSYKIDSTTPQVELLIGPQVNVWIIGGAASQNYCAHEARAR